LLLPSCVKLLIFLKGHSNTVGLCWCSWSPLGKGRLRPLGAAVVDPLNA
jgi:hypothetical protein